MTARTIIGTTALLALLGACGAPTQAPLPGARETIRTQAGAPVVASRAAPIALPPQVAQAEWTHRYGEADHHVTHPALGAVLAPLFTAPIGQGDSRRARIVADPVVSGGAIFTLDAVAQVTATATNGETLWSRSVTPPQGAVSVVSGGGVAVGGGRLYVSTGYGTVTALDAATGAEIWTQSIGAPANGAPTVRGGLVHVVGRDSVAWALDVQTGRVAWQVTGATSLANAADGAAPAVTADVAVLPLPSGEVVGVFPQSGLRRWSTVVAGGRSGQAAAAAMTDIGGDPVIDAGRIYVGNVTGRLVALDAIGGDRLWTADEGAVSPVWPVGGAVFLINDLGQLVRLSTSDGSPVWRVPLPGFVEDNPRRQKTRHAHYGPVLAGGRLIVASSDGVLRQFDPVTGALVGQVALPGGAASHPAVANGTLYVVNRRGELLAFR